MAPSGKAQMKTQKWEKFLTSPVIIKAFGQVASATAFRARTQTSVFWRLYVGILTYSLQRFADGISECI